MAGTGGDMFNYVDELNPYIKSPAIWLCPDAIVNGGMPAAPPYVSVHMNGNVISTTGLNTSQIASEAALVLMRDSGNGLVWQRAYLRPYQNYYNDCDDAYNILPPSGPHNGSFMLLFCDGHAKLLDIYRAKAQVAQHVADTGGGVCP